MSKRKSSGHLTLWDQPAAYKIVSVVWRPPGLLCDWISPLGSKFIEHFQTLALALEWWENNESLMDSTIFYYILHDSNDVALCLL